MEQMLDKGTFLPGIDIRQGGLLYDSEQMKYAGDLLHEAGHLAVLAPEDRAVAQSPDKLNGDLGEGAAEMAAIAWSWAALKHLELEPEVVFHEHGYKGGGKGLIENFSSGCYVGVSILQWVGMSNAAYPAMASWVRTKERAC